MTQWLEVDSWLDLVANAWIGLVVIMVAVVPSYFARKNSHGTAAVLAQVQNAHATNLRDDIDRAIAAVEMVAQDVRGLRADLLQEEQHRRAQISDLREDLDHRTGKHRRI